MQVLADEVPSVRPIKKLYGRSIESFLVRNIHFYSNGCSTEQNQVETDSGQLGKSRLLPVISKGRMSTLLPNLRQQSLSPRKQPRVPPILHYQSQRLLQFHRARQEQIGLNKGKKKFQLEVMKMGEKDVEKQVRKRPSLPSIRLEDIKKTKLLKIKTRTKQNEDDAAIARIVSKQLELGIGRERERYQPISEPITGWTYGLADNDLFF